MSLFPSSPTSGQITNLNGSSYSYDSTKGWLKTATTDSSIINDSATSSTTNTYSIDKIKSLINSGASFEVVTSLPSSNISSSKIYILNSSGTYTMNIYDTSWHVISGSGSSSGTSFTDWIASTNYTTLTSFILNNNNLYRCNTTHTSGTSFSDNSSYWTIIGHIHANKTSLDKIGEDSTTGEMQYNGESVINADVSNRSNGKLIGFNSATGKNEYVDVTVSGIVGSSTITTAGENTTIASGVETTFVHPESDNIVVSIEEEIAGSSVTDTHVDFSDSSDYTLQDSGKMLVGNNIVQLKSLNTTLTSTYTSGTTNYNNTTNNSATTGISLTSPEKNCKRYDNTNSNLTYTGSTTSGTNTSFYNGTQTENITSLKFNFYGTGFYLIAYKYTNYSTSTQVKVDGTALGTFSESGTSQFQTVMYIKKDLALQEHYVEITNQTSNNFVIDAIDILGSNCELRPYSTSFYSSNTPTYLKTTGTSNFSLTTIDTITSLTIPVATTTNSTVKCLFSVDNFTTYLYYDGSAIQKFTGDLTSDWGTTSSDYTQLQTLFTSLSISTLTTMLSSLSIVPVSLDMAFQLNSQSTSETPTIGAITMVYTTKSHNEMASYGNFSESYVHFGVKRVSTSQLSIKNLTSSSKNVKVNIVTSA